MKQLFSTLTLAACLASTGCDAPDELAPPDPVGTWVPELAPSDRPPTMQLIAFKADGTFVAEIRSTATSEALKLSGRWSAAATWREPSCWGRAWEQPSQLEELERTLTGERPERKRLSRGVISLEYWVSRGAELPVGAKVARKYDPSAPPDPFSRLESMVSLEQRPFLRDRRPPNEAKGEQWLVEEVGELIRTSVTGHKSDRLSDQVLALASECLGAEEKAVTTLVVRKVSFHRRGQK